MGVTLSPEERRERQRKYTKKHFEKMREEGGGKYQEYLRVKRVKTTKQNHINKIYKYIDFLQKEYPTMDDTMRKKIADAFPSF